MQGTAQRFAYAPHAFCKVPALGGRGFCLGAEKSRSQPAEGGDRPGKNAPKSTPTLPALSLSKGQVHIIPVIARDAVLGGVLGFLAVYRTM